MDLKALSNAIGTIYELPFDTSKWHEVQQFLTHYSNTVASHVLVFENKAVTGTTVANSNMFSHRGQKVAAQAAQAYNDYYYKFDTGKAAAYSAKMPGKVITNDEITSDFDKRHCPLYNDFNRDFSCERQLILGSTVGDAFANIIATRPKSAGDFSEEDRTLFGILSENILRSIQHCHDLQSLFGHEFVVDTVFQDERNATIFVDDQLNVLWQNRTAQLFLNHGGDLGYRQGRLTIEQSRLRGKLVKLIKRAILSDDTSRDNCSIQKITQNNTPYALTVFSSSERTAFATDKRNVAALIIPIGRPFSDHDIEKLKLVFGLTTGEAKLALAIAKGTTLQEYADANGTSVQTHRKSMQTIMSKTGTNTQHGLAVKIHNLV